MRLSRLPQSLFRIFLGLIALGVFFLTVLWYTIVGSIVMGYIDLKERIKNGSKKSKSKTNPKP